MRPSLRWGSQPLFPLVLCWLLAHPILGFPVGPSPAVKRDLAEAASGDDLIVGSDFLSVFIGASLGNRASRTRNFNTRKRLGSETEQSNNSFGPRSIQQPKNTLHANDNENSAEIGPTLEEISDSKVPSVEFVSLDNASMNKGSFSDASTRFETISSPSSEPQSENLVSDSRKYGRLRSDTSEYSSDTSLESPTASGTVSVSQSNSSSSSESVSSTSPDITNEYTIVTDIVTSREELSSTEPLLEAESQDAQIRTIVEFNNNQHKDVIKESKPFIKHLTKDESFSVSPTPIVTTYHSSYDFSPSPTDSTRVTVSALPESTVQSSIPSIQQVVSVKFSSSVVQGPPASPFLGRPKNNNGIDSGRTNHYHDDLANTPSAPVSEKEMQSDPIVSTHQPVASESISVLQTVHHQEGPTSLVTEEQPAATAIQRSQFSVEEASPSSADVTASRQDPTIFHRTVATVVETSRNSMFRPVSYQTSVSTATSDSRIHFYRQPPFHNREPPSVAETVQTSVVASHRGSMQANYEKTSGQPIVTDDVPIESRMGRYGEAHREIRISGPTDRGITFSTSQQQQVNVEVGRTQKSISSAPHQESAEKNYEFAERSYGQPERIFGQPERMYGQSEKTYGQPERKYGQSETTYGQPERKYGQSETTYGQQERAYGQPEKTYGQPEKTYGQPEKTYGQPEKTYGQTESKFEQSERTYGQPERTYGQREKTYGQPARAYGQPERLYGQPEQNYEVDESVSVMTNGRAYGIQTTTQSSADPNQKVTYVMDGNNYRKYRVEERTSDGFIVGEYGVVSHDDGSLRGVRYTADGTINPRLIQEALVKFLSL